MNLLSEIYRYIVSVGTLPIVKALGGGDQQKGKCWRAKAANN